jgi:hypothetical protein
VVRVRPQIGAWFEELIVKLQVEVMRLQIDCCDHRGHRAGEFAEAIENVLRLQRHTFFELFAVDRRGRSDFRGLLPRAGRVRMEGTARAEFARAQRFHCLGFSADALDPLFDNAIFRESFPTGRNLRIPSFGTSFSPGCRGQKNGASVSKLENCLVIVVTLSATQPIFLPRSPLWECSHLLRAGGQGGLS